MSSDVLYLVALENIADSAIFSNQVKKLLFRIKKEGGDSVSLTLVCLLPWLELTRRGIYSNFRRHRLWLRELEEEFRDRGVRLKLVRTLFPSAFFNMGIMGLAWYCLVALPVVWFLIFISRARVVHCRYYYSCFAALLAARLSFHRVTVIFDVRTFLPEQGIVNGNWSKDSPTFRFWKAVERWMFSHADRVMSVSQSMSRRIKEIIPGVPVETVPNFVDLEFFRPDRDLRERKRLELSLEAREVLVFSGTLGARYPAQRIAECVQVFFRAFGGKSFLLVLTSSDEKRLAPLTGALTSLGFERHVHWQSLAISAGEVPDYLNAADWALLVLADFLTSETFLPLKFGEYLAVGLPILAHPANREIIRLVENDTVGMALDPGMEPQALRARLVENSGQMRKRCLELARREFDIDSYALRYLEIYRELAEKAEYDF